MTSIKVLDKNMTIKEAELINKMIDLETERKVLLVPESKNFGIMTACFIDNEFVLTSDYDVPEDIKSKLKKA